MLSTLLPSCLCGSLPTHYICIKDKDGKDIFVMRRGDVKELNKKEASGKFVEVKDEKNQTK